MAIKAPMLPTLRLALPHPDIGILHGFAAAVDYLPLLLPFALLTVVGGVNNAESARVAGDDYDVRSILLGEAAATLAAGLWEEWRRPPLTSAIAPTSRWVRGPDTRCLPACSSGWEECSGYLSNLIELMPIAVLAPVLVFVALDITVQAFQAVPVRHAPAVALSFFPSIARLVWIELSNPEFVPAARLAQLLTASEQGLPALAVILALGNGFIVTATLWGAFMVELTERRLRAAAWYLIAAGALACFGIIHSVRTDGSAYALWQLEGTPAVVATQFCLAYFILAAALLLLSLQPRGN